jgi:hypothetical protein
MPDTESLKEKVEEFRCQTDSRRKTRISRQNVPESFWNAAVELFGGTICLGPGFESQPFALRCAQRPGVKLNPSLSMAGKKVSFC